MDSIGIAEIDIADYETTDHETNLRQTSDYFTPFDRTQEKVSVSLEAVRVSRPGLLFNVTLYPQNFPPLGNPRSSNSPGASGWSYIIDPVCYVYRDELEESANAPLRAEFTGSANTATLHFDTPSGNRAEVTMGNVGGNSLFDIRAILIDGVNRMGYLTDCLSPVQVKSLEANVDSGGIAYTGGYHTQSGAITAQQFDVAFSIDGVDVPTDFAGAKSGVAFTASFKQKLYAYNTISLQRHVLERYFEIIVSNGSVKVYNKTIPLENVRIEADNGLQFPFFNIYSDVLFFNGAEKTAWRPLYQTEGDPQPDSGLKALAPDVCGMCLRANDVAHYTWIDRHYGIGDRRRLTGNTSTSLFFTAKQKAYARLIWKNQG